MWEKYRHGTLAIWFSGKNQAGILKEEIEVKSLTNLQELNNLRDLSVGMLETVKRLPGYKKAITKLTEELKENKEDVE